MLTNRVTRRYDWSSAVRQSRCERCSRPRSSWSTGSPRASTAGTRSTLRRTSAPSARPSGRASNSRGYDVPPRRVTRRRRPDDRRHGRRARRVIEAIDADDLADGRSASPTCCSDAPAPAPSSTPTARRVEPALPRTRRHASGSAGRPGSLPDSRWPSVRPDAGRLGVCARRPVRPGAPGHLPQRWPAVLLDPLPEPDEERRPPGARTDAERRRPRLAPWVSGSATSGST